jgi:hypothetical protein
MEASALKKYEANRFAEGLEKGKEEKTWTVAKRMISKGQPSEEACEMTELSIKTVQALAEEISGKAGRTDAFH